MFFKKKPFNRSRIGSLTIGEPSGPIIRVASILIDISFSYLMWKLLLERVEIFYSYYITVELMLYEYLELGVRITVPKHLKPFMQLPAFLKLLKLSIYYWFIYFSSSFLLGVSFGKWVVGIKVMEGSFLGKRLRAVARVVISMATTPLVVFDMPAMFGRRTLKEVLSKTHFINSNTVRSLLGILAFAPIFVFLALSVYESNCSLLKGCEPAWELVNFFKNLL